MEQPLAVDGENSRAKVQNVGGDSPEDCRTLYIRQKAKRGEIQPYLKTHNGERDIDLCTALAGIIKEHIGIRTSGLLFCTSTGEQIPQRNILRAVSIPS